MNSKEEQLNLKIEEVHPCIRTAVAEFPADYVDRQRDEAIKHFTQNSACPGFRKGKAPKSMVLSRHGADIDRHLGSVLAKAAFAKFVENKDLDFLMTPDIEGDLPKIEQGKEYILKLKGYVVPPMDLPDYKGISLERESDKVSEEDVDKEIKRFCELYAEFQEVDEPAVSGDMLKISYTSDFDPGESARTAIKRYASASDTWCVLCDPEMLPGIVAAMLGCRPGEKRKLTSEFPADFPESEIAGRKVAYEIELHSIQRRTPLKSAEALKDKIGLDDVGKMRDHISEAMSDSRRNQSRMKVEHDALEHVSKATKDIDIPMELLGRFILVEIEDLINSMVRTNDDLKEFRKSEEHYRKIAESLARKKIEIFLACRKIARIENISVKDEEIQNELSRLESHSGLDKQRFRKFITRPGRLDSMHVNLLVAKIARMIVKNAEIKEVPWKGSEGDRDAKAREPGK
ncbi:MAG: trigger factor [Victivallales bacterium]|nr:trigger factor [Victivallales bacterium]